MRPTFSWISVLAIQHFVTFCGSTQSPNQLPFLLPDPKELGDIEETSSSALPLPRGPLPWGDLNILSTTDTHGWVRGHTHRDFIPERLYSADTGDLASFRYWLQGEADKRGVDFLFVDSGDTVDGNGFVDADTSGIKGAAARDILKGLGWDITTTGNHELYNFTVAADVYANFIPSFAGRYLSSNVDIIPPSSRSDATAVPFGSRYYNFVTKNQKRKITSFGVMFDFDRPAPGLAVQSPKEMVKEKWWKKVMTEIETDIFVLVGHMATRDSDWQVVLDAVRSYHPTAPILFFSGHAHVRDCIRPDGRSQVLASGRYLETLGFTSLQLPVGSVESDEDLSISRRYLDTNLATYYFHSNQSQRTFLTSQGKQIKRRLQAYSQSFNLSYSFGVAPQSYYLDRYPPNHHKSLINLYATEVFRRVLNTPPAGRTGKDPIFLFNTGAARFDIFKGPFTRDDQFTVIPFENGMWYVPDLKIEVVESMLYLLNNLPGEPELWHSFNEAESDPDDPANAKILADSLAVQLTRRRNAASCLRLTSKGGKEDVEHAMKEPAVTYGYVTQDKCGPQAGDDTIHRPLPAYPIPDFVLSTKPAGIKPSDKVDLVFYEFIAPLVINALNNIQKEKVYRRDDIRVYSKLKANELLGEYARLAWN